MGSAERSNPQSRDKVGQYNVVVHITYTDGENIGDNIVAIKAKTWRQNGDYLALSIAEDHLMIVCLKNVYNYSIMPQEVVPEIVT